MSCSRNLPQEIITDILSRLPVKSLLRFKSVSCLWKSLISEPHFAKTHLDRTKMTNYPQRKIVTISYCGNLNLVDYKEVNPTSTKLEFPTVEQNDPVKWEKVLSSCDGLLLVCRSDKSIFLLNPSTRECKKLPTCPFQDSSNITFNPYGLAYDSSTDDYKILMLSYCTYDRSMGSYMTNVAVYSLKTNAWRRIDSQYQFSGQNKHVFSGYIKGDPGVFFNGCLHFLWLRKLCCITIIVVDLSNEIVREMALPSSVRKCQHLVVLGGSLCLVDAVAREIWMMKAYGEIESWTKFTMCSGDSNIDALWMLAEDEFLLLEINACGQKQLIVYNPHKFTKRVIYGTPTNFRLWDTCVESLISPFHVEGIGRQI